MLPETFGRELGTVYKSAVLWAHSAGIVSYDKLHEVGMAAVEAWLDRVEEVKE